MPPSSTRSWMRMTFGCVTLRAAATSRRKRSIARRIAEAGVDDLERHALGQLAVGGQVDRAHAAGAELALDGVAIGDLLPRRQRHRQKRSHRPRRGHRRTERLRVLRRGQGAHGRLRGEHAVEPRVELEVDRADDALQVLHARLELLALLALLLELLRVLLLLGPQLLHLVLEVLRDAHDGDGHSEDDHYDAGAIVHWMRDTVAAHAQASAAPRHASAAPRRRAHRRRLAQAASRRRRRRHRRLRQGQEAVAQGSAAALPDGGGAAEEGRRRRRGEGAARRR